jgi:hypothetical protein
MSSLRLHLCMSASCVRAYVNDSRDACLCVSLQAYACWRAYACVDVCALSPVLAVVRKGRCRCDQCFLIGCMQSGHDNWVRGVFWHASGKYIVSVSDDRSVKVSAAAPSYCATLATASPPFRAASLDPFGSLARGRVPSGSTLVPQRGNGALFYSQVWDIAAKRCTKTLRDAHPHFVRLDCCSHLLCDYAACRIGMGSVVKPLVAA